MNASRQGKKKAGGAVTSERVGAYVAREWRMRHASQRPDGPNTYYVPKSADAVGVMKLFECVISAEGTLGKQLMSCYIY